MTAVLQMLSPGGSPPSDGYSQAVVSDGPLVHIAGQVSVDRANVTVGVGDFAAQVEQALNNLEAALAGAGGGFASLAALTIYCVASVDRKALPALSRSLRARIGERPPPAITLVFVAALLHPHWLIEVQAVGVAGPITSPRDRAMLDLGA